MQSDTSFVYRLTLLHQNAPEGREKLRQRDRAQAAPFVDPESWQTDIASSFARRLSRAAPPKSSSRCSYNKSSLRLHAGCLARCLQLVSGVTCSAACSLPSLIWPIRTSYRGLRSSEIPNSRKVKAYRLSVYQLTSQIDTSRATPFNNMVQGMRFVRCCVPHRRRLSQAHYSWRLSEGEPDGVLPAAFAPFS